MQYTPIIDVPGYKKDSHDMHTAETIVLDSCDTLKDACIARMKYMREHCGGVRFLETKTPTEAIQHLNKTAAGKK